MRVLELTGRAAPVTSGALEASPPLPHDAVELLTTWGPGRLCGHFDLRSPDDPTARAWQTTLRSRSARERGWFAAITVEQLPRFHVLAVDGEGHAIACGPRPGRGGGPSWWFFAADGRVVWVGDDLEQHLVSTFLMGDAGFARLTGERRAHLPVYAVGAQASVDDLLRCLSGGDEDGADALLPELVGGNDASTVHRRVLADLIGEPGDAVPDELRRSYVRQIVKMLSRVDAPAVRGAPERLAQGERFPTDEERGWAGTLPPPAQVARGPFGLDAPPPGEAVAHDARACVTSLGAPRVDGPPRIEAAVRAWEAHLPRSALAPVWAALAKVDALAQQSALAAMTELCQPAQRVVGCPGDGTVARPDEDTLAERTQRALAYLRDTPPETMAIFALALRDAEPQVASVAWSLLGRSEAAAPSMVPLGLSLVFHPPPAPSRSYDVPAGHERVGFAPVAWEIARRQTPDDRLVEQLLPLLASPDRWQRDQAAHLLAERVDVDAVFEAFLSDVDGLDARGPHPPRPPAVRQLWNAKADDPDFGTLVDALFAECGASTRALARRADERARAALRKAARRGELNTRVHAGAALAKLGDPAGRTLLAAALRAYDRI